MCKAAIKLFPLKLHVFFLFCLEKQCLVSSTEVENSNLLIEVPLQKEGSGAPLCIVLTRLG